MYREHCLNLVEVENGIKRLELDLRHFIATLDFKNEYTYTKILSQVITCWTEVRILKLIYEHRAFTQNEINIILRGNATLESKWKDALSIAISKAYNIHYNVNYNSRNLILSIGDNIESQLTGDTLNKYVEINRLITEELLPSIQLRNRIAHGQWKIAFNSHLTAISTSLTTQLLDENIILLQLKKKMFVGLARLIHDLAVSPPTFVRDFNQNYRLIEENKRNLHKRDYQVYKQNMIDKYRRGQQKKNQENTTSQIDKKYSFIEKLRILFS